MKNGKEGSKGQSRGPTFVSTVELDPQVSKSGADIGQISPRSALLLARLMGQYCFAR